MDKRLQEHALRLCQNLDVVHAAMPKMLSSGKQLFLHGDKAS
jgi:hypothetical protein